MIDRWPTVLAMLPRLRRIVASEAYRSGRSARELESDAIEMAYSVLLRFDPRRGWSCEDFVAWVVARRLRHRADVPLDWLECQDPSAWWDAEGDVDHGRLEASVRAAVCGLDQRARAVIELAYWRGLPDVEIGRQLGISRPWVQQIRAGAESQLAQRIADAVGPGAFAVESLADTAIAGVVTGEGADRIT